MQVSTQLLATPSNPYDNEAINKIYNQLFCDNMEMYESKGIMNMYPWTILFANNPDIEELETIIHDDNLQSRHKLLAYNLLSAVGESMEEKELLGVIVEVALPEGLDVIAAFRDGTARYINYTGKLLVWDAETEESSDLVSKLFSDSRSVINRIGPWDKERLPFPINDKVRLSFLVSDGLYFGEGPFEFLQNDELGGPVINSAAALMTFLIDKSIGK